MRILLTLLLAVLIALPGALAAADDFRITLAPGAEPQFEGQGVAANLTAHQPGEVLEWNLTTTKGQLVGTVVSHAYFTVAWPKQVRPDVDPRATVDVGTAEDVDEARLGTQMVNYTQSGQDLVLRLTFPANGTATLRLERDVKAPNFTLDPIANLTHNSFFTRTHTDEYARADLILQPPTGEPLRNPTVIWSFLQNFSVIGLRPDTTYMVHGVFHDWSDNTARSPAFAVRTLPLPDFPKPLVTAREPPANATLAQGPTLIAVNFTGPAPASTDGVAFFVDKVPQHRGVALLEGRAELRLDQPLANGKHTASVELTSAEGGTTLERWEFQVGPATPAPPLLLVVLALAGAAWAARRAR